MFIWDFILGTVMDQIIEWLYGQVVGFLADFFAQMGNMGVELFEMSWSPSSCFFLVWLGRCTEPGWWCRHLKPALNTSTAGAA